ncbi:MAG: hypothetical protein P0S96_06280 [Simkaniaceae bacterium]|nr:hypothetical protein [Candidatus Sacchlamyda saccharinae]
MTNPVGNESFPWETILPTAAAVATGALVLLCCRVQRAAALPAAPGIAARLADRVVRPPLFEFDSSDPEPFIPPSIEKFREEIERQNTDPEFSPSDRLFVEYLTCLTFKTPKWLQREKISYTSEEGPLPGFTVKYKSHHDPTGHKRAMDGRYFDHFRDAATNREYPIDREYFDFARLKAPALRMLPYQFADPSSLYHGDWRPFPTLFLMGCIRTMGSKMDFAGLDQLIKLRRKLDLSKEAYTALKPVFLSAVRKLAREEDFGPDSPAYWGLLAICLRDQQIYGKPLLSHQICQEVENLHAYDPRPGPGEKLPMTPGRQAFLNACIGVKRVKAARTSGAPGKAEELS